MKTETPATQPPVTVSVIIPAYNASPWIEEALASVCSQQLPAPAVMEVIVVDDGSSDNTAGICHKAAAGDKRIRVVSRPNGGVSAARNAGIEMARGEWICFVDADDTLRPDAIATLLAAVGDDRRAIALSKPLFKDSDEGMDRHPSAATCITYNPREAIERCLYRRDIDPTMCGVLIPAEFLDAGTRFYPGRYEDLDLSYRVFEKATAVKLITRPLYFYRCHRDSFINRFTAARLDVLDVVERMRRHFKGTQLEKAADDRTISACFNLLHLIYTAAPEDPSISPHIADARSRCRRLIKQLRTRVLLNPRGRMLNKPVILASYLGPAALRFILTRKRP